jgi:hypothetical protein
MLIDILHALNEAKFAVDRLEYELNEALYKTGDAKYEDLRDKCRQVQELLAEEIL